MARCSTSTDNLIFVFLALTNIQMAHSDWSTGSISLGFSVAAPLDHRLAIAPENFVVKAYVNPALLAFDSNPNIRAFIANAAQGFNEHLAPAAARMFDAGLTAAWPDLTEAQRQSYLPYSTPTYNPIRNVTRRGYAGPALPPGSSGGCYEFPGASPGIYTQSIGNRNISTSPRDPSGVDMMDNANLKPYHLEHVAKMHRFLTTLLDKGRHHSFSVDERKILDAVNASLAKFPAWSTVMLEAPDVSSCEDEYSFGVGDTMFKGMSNKEGSEKKRSQPDTFTASQPPPKHPRSNVATSSSTIAPNLPPFPPRSNLTVPRASSEEVRGFGQITNLDGSTGYVTSIGNWFRKAGPVRLPAVSSTSTAASVSTEAAVGSSTAIAVQESNSKVVKGNVQPELLAEGLDDSPKLTAANEPVAETTSTEAAPVSEGPKVRRSTRIGAMKNKEGKVVLK